MTESRAGVNRMDETVLSAIRPHPITFEQMGVGDTVVWHGAPTVRTVTSKDPVIIPAGQELHGIAPTRDAAAYVVGFADGHVTIQFATMPIIRLLTADTPVTTTTDEHPSQVEDGR